MKRSLIAVLLFALLIPGAVFADICTIDQVPAATLLLPYFEVDLGNTNGSTTLFSINNASATAVLAHVVFWTDLSVPTLDFNVYLTGYDVVTLSVGDIFRSGTLPRTASAGQDPGDSISNHGDFSQDINFASCTGQLPYPATGALNAAFRTHLANAHTGKFSAVLGGCGGQNLGDNIARGYVTVDTVNNCSLEFPGDPGYFAAGGTGTATLQNSLWGDWFMVNPSENYAQGDTLVHVEASATNPETSLNGQYTFYGRYVNWTAIDNREPLSTNFGVRFLNGGIFDGGTDLLVWRDSKVDQEPFVCGRVPEWYPLGQEQIVVFDEEENPEQSEGCTVSPCPEDDLLTPFPAETNRTEVGGEELPVTPNFGWIFLDLNTTVAAAGDNPPEDPAAAQAWVSAVHSANGRFSVGLNAVQFDDACNANHSGIGF